MGEAGRELDSDGAWQMKRRTSYSSTTWMQGASSSQIPCCASTGLHIEEAVSGITESEKYLLTLGQMRSICPLCRQPTYPQEREPPPPLTLPRFCAGRPPRESRGGLSGLRRALRPAFWSKFRLFLSSGQDLYQDNRWILFAKPHVWG